MTQLWAWIWPFSLYDHIRALEEIVVKLTNENGELKQQLLEAQRREGKTHGTTGQ
jgi:hypothetical protein